MTDLIDKFTIQTSSISTSSLVLPNANEPSITTVNSITTSTEENNILDKSIPTIGYVKEQLQTTNAETINTTNINALIEDDGIETMQSNILNIGTDSNRSVNVNIGNSDNRLNLINTITLNNYSTEQPNSEVIGEDETLNQRLIDVPIEDMQEKTYNVYDKFFLDINYTVSKDKQTISKPMIDGLEIPDEVLEMIYSQSTASSFRIYRYSINKKTNETDFVNILDLKYKPNSTTVYLESEFENNTSIRDELKDNAVFKRNRLNLSANGETVKISANMPNVSDYRNLMNCYDNGTEPSAYLKQYDLDYTYDSSAETISDNNAAYKTLKSSLAANDARHYKTRNGKVIKRVFACDYTAIITSNSSYKVSTASSYPAFSGGKVVYLTEEVLTGDDGVGDTYYITVRKTSDTPTDSGTNIGKYKYYIKGSDTGGKYRTSNIKVVKIKNNIISRASYPVASITETNYYNLSYYKNYSEFLINSEYFYQIGITWSTSALCNKSATTITSGSLFYSYRYKFKPPTTIKFASNESATTLETRKMIFDKYPGSINKDFTITFASKEEKQTYMNYYNSQYLFSPDNTTLSDDTTLTYTCNYYSNNLNVITYNSNNYDVTKFTIYNHDNYFENNTATLNTYSIGTPITTDTSLTNKLYLLSGSGIETYCSLNANQQIIHIKETNCGVNKDLTFTPTTTQDNITYHTVSGTNNYELQLNYNTVGIKDGKASNITTNTILLDKIKFANDYTALKECYNSLSETTQYINGISLADDVYNALGDIYYPSNGSTVYTEYNRITAPNKLGVSYSGKIGHYIIDNLNNRYIAGNEYFYLNDTGTATSNNKTIGKITTSSRYYLYKSMAFLTPKYVLDATTMTQKLFSEDGILDKIARGERDRLIKLDFIENTTNKPNTYLTSTRTLTISASTANGGRGTLSTSISDTLYTNTGAFTSSVRVPGIYTYTAIRTPSSYTTLPQDASSTTKVYLSPILSNKILNEFNSTYDIDYMRIGHMINIYPNLKITGTYVPKSGSTADKFTGIKYQLGYDSIYAGLISSTSLLSNLQFKIDLSNNTNLISSNQITLYDSTKITVQYDDDNKPFAIIDTKVIIDNIIAQNKVFSSSYRRDNQITRKFIAFTSNETYTIIPTGESANITYTNYYAVKERGFEDIIKTKFIAVLNNTSRLLLPCEYYNSFFVSNGELTTAKINSYNNEGIHLDNITIKDNKISSQSLLLNNTSITTTDEQDTLQTDRIIVDELIVNKLNDINGVFISDIKIGTVYKLITSSTSTLTLINNSTLTNNNGYYISVNTIAENINAHNNDNTINLIAYDNNSNVIDNIDNINDIKYIKLSNNSLIELEPYKTNASIDSQGNISAEKITIGNTTIQKSSITSTELKVNNNNKLSSSGLIASELKVNNNNKLTSTGLTTSSIDTTTIKSNSNNVLTYSSAETTADNTTTLTKTVNVLDDIVITSKTISTTENDETTTNYEYDISTTKSTLTINGQPIGTSNSNYYEQQTNTSITSSGITTNGLTITGTTPITITYDYLKSLEDFRDNYAARWIVYMKQPYTDITVSSTSNVPTITSFNSSTNANDKLDKKLYSIHKYLSSLITKNKISSSNYIFKNFALKIDNNKLYYTPNGNWIEFNLSNYSLSITSFNGYSFKYGTYNDNGIDRPVLILSSSSSNIYFKCYTQDEMNCRY